MDHIEMIKTSPLTTYRVEGSEVHHACILVEGGRPNAERPLCQGFVWWIPAKGDVVDYDATHMIDCGNCRRMNFFKEHIMPFEENQARTLYDPGLSDEDPRSRTWTPPWTSDHIGIYGGGKEETGVNEEDEDRVQQLAWFPSVGPDESAYIALLVENNQRAIGLIPIEDGIEIWEIRR